MAGEVTGGTFNEKWIDGGTAATNPRFDVDDPTFWTPMSVISGLASGFCERADVVLPGQGFDNGVTAVAENIANGTVPTTNMTNMLTIVDTPFSPPSATGSNYMKTVDKLLSNLIIAGGTAGYVKTDNTPYTDYSELAAQAQARATGAGSACGTIESDGGLLCATGEITYPVIWAKQRKWMLDELRLTAGTPTPLPIAAVSSAACVPIYNPAEAEGDKYIEIERSVQGGIVSSLIHESMEDLYTSAITNATFKPWQLGYPYDSISFDHDNVAFSIEARTTNNGTTLFVKTPEQNQGTNYFYNFVPGNILVSGSDVNVGDEIKLYYTVFVDSVESSSINERNLEKIHTTNVENGTNTSGYVVLSDGHLTMQSGAECGTVVVSEGGQLTISKGAHVRTLNIMDGATVSFKGFSNGGSEYLSPIRYLYVDYYCITSNYPFYGIYRSTGMTSNVATGSDYYYTLDGATVTLTGPGSNVYPASVSAYLYNGASLILKGNVDFYGVIGPGCQVIQSHTAASACIGSCHITPGGRLTVIGNQYAETRYNALTNLFFYPGCSATISSASIEEMHVAEGANINLIYGQTASVQLCTLTRFTDFGMPNINQGWNSYIITEDTSGDSTHIIYNTITIDGQQSLEKTDTVLVTGSTNVVTARSQLDAATTDITALPNSTEFPGTCIINGFTGSIADLFHDMLCENKAILWNTLHVAGIGGGTSTVIPASPVNHYEEFDNRQSETDPPTANN